MNIISNRNVESTNDRSIGSKRSASSCGYFNDNIISLFHKPQCRRSPLINRGYYIRMICIDRLLRNFIQKWPQCNIISLGAGFDTTFFRLRSESTLSKLKFHYIEIDYYSVSHSKLQVIENSSNLLNLCGEFESLESVRTPVLLKSKNFTLIGHDLRDINTLVDLLRQSLDIKLPTLIFSECVLTYIESKSVDQLILCMSSLFRDSTFITYEQCCFHSGFENIMCGHFKKNNSPLLNIHVYPTRDSQCKRYHDNGFENCISMDMNDFFNSLPLEEKDRLSKLEIFDEYEEWHLKCAHYFVLIACKGLTNQHNDIISHYCKSYERINVSLLPKNDVTVKVLPSNFLCYGHSSTILFPDVLIIFGGVRNLNGIHRRHSSLTLISLKTLQLISSAAEDNFQLNIPSVFASVVVDSKSIAYIFGGRDSPNVSSNDIVSLQCDITRKNNICTYNLCNYERIRSDSENVPNKRWRHTLTKVNIKERLYFEDIDCKQSCNDIFILFGGKDKDEIFDDIWLLHIRDNTFDWKILETDKPLKKRHSHSAAVWHRQDQSDILIISGGLGEYENVLSDVVLVTCTHQAILSVSFLETKQKVIPRYSHSSHVFKDKLIVIGGVTSRCNAYPGITIIDLNCGSIRELGLPGVVDSEPFLCHNHISFLSHMQESEKFEESEVEIIIVGGGGNCFSFGTHFNRFIYQVKLTPQILENT